MSGWNVGLWIVQVLAAILFVLVGSMKLLSPYEQMNALMPWTQALPEVAIRIIALCELLGALALLLPSILRIQPQLTAYAAGALALVMVLAAIFHGMRGEMANIVPPLILASLVAFVAWGRLTKAPITPRLAHMSED